MCHGVIVGPRCLLGGGKQKLPVIAAESTPQREWDPVSEVPPLRGISPTTAWDLGPRIHLKRLLAIFSEAKSFRGKISDHAEILEDWHALDVAIRQCGFGMRVGFCPRGVATKPSAD